MISLAAVSMATLMASCSDSGETKKAEAPAASTAEAPKPTETAQAPAAAAPSAEPTKPVETAQTPAATPAAEPAKPVAAADAPKSEGTVSVTELMAAGALPEMSLGKADAPVTIVEYASMTCPHCADFAEKTTPQLISKYVDTGKVRLVFREFPFDPRAEAAFMLARCSKDNYFPMVEVLFKQQANWAGVDNARDALFNLAKLAGFTQQSFEACLTDQALLENIRKVREQGEKLGVNSTPTFFINGEKYPGALSIEKISAIIDPKL